MSGSFRKVILPVGIALSLLGSLLAIFGVFLRWGFGIDIWGPPDISGWDMITATVSGNLNVFLVLIGGVIAFLGGLALAFFRRPGLVYLLGLGMVLTVIGCIWSLQKYGSVPPGVFVSMFGTLLLAIGAVLLIFIKPQQ